MPTQRWSARERQYDLGKTTTLDRSSNGHSSEGRTYEQLYEEAKRRNIQGRSKMSKTELERALGGR